MVYPKEVIAVTSKGKKEARVFVEKGVYTRYTYADSETGKPVKKGKESVFLKNESGQYEQLFIVPMQAGRSLLFRTKEAEEAVKARELWDSKKKRAIELFEK